MKVSKKSSLVKYLVPLAIVIGLFVLAFYLIQYFRQEGAIAGLSSTTTKTPSSAPAGPATLTATARRAMPSVSTGTGSVPTKVPPAKGQAASVGTANPGIKLYRSG